MKKLNLYLMLLALGTCFFNDYIVWSQPKVLSKEAMQKKMIIEKHRHSASHKAAGSRRPGASHKAAGSRRPGASHKASGARRHSASHKGKGAGRLGCKGGKCLLRRK